jgi:hypothetical protein
MHKSALLILSFSLFACSKLPPFPEVYKCAWAGEPRAFFCVNTETGARIRVAPMDSSMNGAQCLSLEDYRKSENWVETIKKMAEKRCN